LALYYSLGDLRWPAYWRSSQGDPTELQTFRSVVHGRLRELLTNYGQIDLVWFDGPWPHNAQAWQSEKILEMCHELQPGIITNNRLDTDSAYSASDGNLEDPGQSQTLGDYGTPEHHTTASVGRLWESCQVSTSRLWGYTPGEHWRPTWDLLDNLCQCASTGGNLLLNVGPDPEGRFPEAYLKRSKAIGDWLKINGEAVYGAGGGDVTDFTVRGYQTVRDNMLYLILRFESTPPDVRVYGLKTKVKSARLLGSDQTLTVEQEDELLVVRGVPAAGSHDLPLYPVIALECEGEPEATKFGCDRMWSGDPSRYLPWVATGSNALQRLSPSDIK
jgi:alpha-L-fucosidase